MAILCERSGVMRRYRKRMLIFIVLFCHQLMEGQESLERDGTQKTL